MDRLNTDCDSFKFITRTQPHFFLNFRLIPQLLKLTPFLFHLVFFVRVAHGAEKWKKFLSMFTERTHEAVKRKNHWLTTAVDVLFPYFPTLPVDSVTSEIITPAPLTLRRPWDDPLGDIPRSLH